MLVLAEILLITTITKTAPLKLTNSTNNNPLPPPTDWLAKGFRAKRETRRAGCEVCEANREGRVSYTLPDTLSLSQPTPSFSSKKMSLERSERWRLGVSKEGCRAKRGGVNFDTESRKGSAGSNQPANRN